MILVIERLGVLGQEREHEIVGERGEVVDKRRDTGESIASSESMSRNGR
jgi:hypothetical protein